MFLQSKNSLRGRSGVFVRSLILLGALVLFSPLDSVLNSHFIVGASAESEAGSEAASEAPMTGGRGRRGYYRYQMQQQRQAAQQTRKQQQMQNQQQKKRNGGGQGAKPFRVSDYIHEYGSGRAQGNLNRQNLSGGNSGNASGLASSAGQATGSASSSASASGNTSSVPFQKFPPK